MKNVSFIEIGSSIKEVYRYRIWLDKWTSWFLYIPQTLFAGDTKTYDDFKEKHDRNELEIS